MKRQRKPLVPDGRHRVKDEVGSVHLEETPKGWWYWVEQDCLYEDRIEMVKAVFAHAEEQGYTGFPIHFKHSTESGRSFAEHFMKALKKE